jgi:hypothetical protein
VTTTKKGENSGIVKVLNFNLKKNDPI